MTEILGFLTAFAIFGILAYFAVKFFNSASKKELKEWEDNLFPKFESVFGETPSRYGRGDKHEVIDSILKELMNELFASRTQPERYVVEGTDREGRDFIAAVVRGVHHQSGGRRIYRVLYVLKTEDEKVISKCDKKIGSWCVFYKEILNTEEEPVLNDIDFNKLVSRTN